MKHFKISKLLNDWTASKFATRKWIEANDLSGGSYSVNKNMSFKRSMLRSDLCDYNAYVVVKGRISVAGTKWCPYCCKKKNVLQALIDLTNEIKS